jgi:hypothetical protein
VTGRRERAADAAALAAALIVLGPALAPGYVLAGDMVFVPRLPLSEALLGLASSAPRAVPSDLVVALSSAVLPGQLVQKVILLLILAGGGAGAGRVLPLGPAGSAAAAVAFVWNPYVAERLALGQWAVLVGYAALPWVVRAAWRLGAAPDRRGWRRMTVAAALGALGGAPAWLLILLGAVPAYALGARRRRDRRAVWARGAIFALGLLALALPWAVPALTRPGGTVGASTGAAFRPQLDTPLGVLGSLLTQGGIWNTQVIPAGRDTVVGAMAAVLVLAVGVGGLLSARSGSEWHGARRRDPDDMPGLVLALVVSASAGLLLAVAVLAPGIDDWLAAVPGGGLLRDGSRQVAPWVLALAAGLGLAVERVRARAGFLAPVGGPGLALLLALLPVAALPAAGWGLAGRLHPVDYPKDYGDVAAFVSQRPGGVVVLPFEAYRRFAWNGGRPGLEPLPRWLDAVTVVSSDLIVRRSDGSAVRVPGEDRLADRVRDLLAGPAPATDLGRLGIRWVVLDVAGVAAPTGLRQVYAGSSLRAYEVPVVDEVTAAAVDAGWRPPRAGVLAADAIALAVIVAGLLAGPARAGGPRARRADGAVARSAASPLEPGDTLR